MCTYCANLFGELNARACPSLLVQNLHLCGRPRSTALSYSERGLLMHGRYRDLVAVEGKVPRNAFLEAVEWANAPDNHARLLAEWSRLNEH
jgi:hypothetical protein